MNPLLIVLSFTAVAVMRVIQKVCSKKVSGEVEGKTFFHYGGYYNLMSALFSLITLAFVGFYGFDLPTVLCALGTAIFMAIELFAGIEALKGGYPYRQSDVRRGCVVYSLPRRDLPV